jgi:hypothetical protein
MGRALGVSRQAVHQWEKGELPPGLFLLLTTALHSTDWRKDFALAALEIHPKLAPDYRAAITRRQSSEESG